MPDDSGIASTRPASLVGHAAICVCAAASIRAPMMGAGPGGPWKGFPCHKRRAWLGLVASCVLTLGSDAANHRSAGKGHTGGDMTREHPPLRRLRVAMVTAAVAIGAPAAHAFEMDTIANSNGGTKYVDPGDRLEDMANGKTTTVPGNRLQFGVGSVNSFAPGSRVGLPPDQSRFNDR